MILNKKKGDFMATKMTKKYKKLKRSKEYKIIMLIVSLLIAGIIYFFFSQPNVDIVYSSSQNDDGFYYYVRETETSSYYYDANDLESIQLQNKLYDIISTNFQAKTYDDARDILQEADATLEDSSKVLNIYDGTMVQAVWDAGVTWNREHVWPNSRLGVDRVNGSERSIASDLHNLRAATPRVNSARSDRVYTDGSGKYEVNEDGGFYPGDEHIGDVARILFYMVTMYDELTLTNDMNDLLDESDHYTPNGARMGVLSILLKWHKLDPVDDFERQRNDVIFVEQGNRNPFIDHPEYVHLIWEEKTVSDLIKPVEETVETSFFNTHLLALIEKEYIYGKNL